MKIGELRCNNSLILVISLIVSNLKSTNQWFHFVEWSFYLNDMGTNANARPCIWHYELTWDPRTVKTPRVCRRSLSPLTQPLPYGCLWTPLDPSNQGLTFWAGLGLQGHWGYAKVPLSYLSQTPNMSVYGLPLTSAIKIWHLKLTWDPMDIEGVWRFLFHFFHKPP